VIAAFIVPMERLNARQYKRAEVAADNFVASLINGAEWM
jgi:hypothetical protein